MKELHTLRILCLTMVFYNYTSEAPAGTSVATVNESTATHDAAITSATPDGCTSGTSSMPVPVNAAEANEDAAGIYVASQGL